MYAKLIDGAIQWAPKKIKDGDTTTYNPTVEMLGALGYLPVTATDPPEAPEGYYAESYWEEQDDTIVQMWRMVEEVIPEEIVVEEG